MISDNGKIVLATLKAGSYFGEISILNMGMFFLERKVKYINPISKKQKQK